MMHSVSVLVSDSKAVKACAGIQLGWCNLNLDVYLFLLVHAVTVTMQAAATTLSQPPVQQAPPSPAIYQGRQHTSGLAGACKLCLLRLRSHMLVCLLHQRLLRACLYAYYHTVEQHTDMTDVSIQALIIGPHAHTSKGVCLHCVVLHLRRYIVRVEACDGKSAPVVVDHAVLVRKQGDTQGKAPCCRYSVALVDETIIV